MSVWFRPLALLGILLALGTNLQSHLLRVLPVMAAGASAGLAPYVSQVESRVDAVTVALTPSISAQAASLPAKMRDRHAAQPLHPNAPSRILHASGDRSHGTYAAR